MVHYEYNISMDIKCVFYGRNEEVAVLKCRRKECKSNNKHPISVK